MTLQAYSGRNPLITDRVRSCVVVACGIFLARRQAILPMRP